MSMGMGILVGILLVVGFIVGSQWLLGRFAKRMEGQPVPPLEGEWAEIASGNAVLWFHSPSCGPCRQMHPYVRASGAHEVDVSKPDAMAVAQAFGIMGTPTTVAIKDGQVMTVRMGVVPKAEFEALVAGA